jgi:hypothetical protein
MTIKAKLCFSIIAENDAEALAKSEDLLKLDIEGVLGLPDDVYDEIAPRLFIQGTPKIIDDRPKTEEA